MVACPPVEITAATPPLKHPFLPPGLMGPSVDEDESLLPAKVWLERDPEDLWDVFDKPMILGHGQGS